MMLYTIQLSTICTNVSLPFQFWVEHRRNVTIRYRETFISVSNVFFQTNAAVTPAVGRDLSVPFIPTQVCRLADVRPVTTWRQ